MARTWLPLVLVLGAVLVVYEPLRRAEFLQWDDAKTIVSNPDLNPPSISGVMRYWDPRRPYMDLYVPVAYTAWAGVASVAGKTPSPSGRPRLDPAAFHIASLVVHAFATVLAFMILRRILEENRPAPARATGKRGASTGPRRGLDPVPWAGGIGAGLFALHPLQVETVAWASGLKDVLGGAFTLAALWLYLLFVSERRRQREDHSGTDAATSSAADAKRPIAPSDSRGSRLSSATRSARDRPPLVSRPRSPAQLGERDRLGARLLFTLATIAFVLAMLSKPSAVVTPLLAACLVLAIRRGRGDSHEEVVQPAVGASADDASSTRLRARIASIRTGLPFLTPLALWLVLALPITLIARHAQPAATGFASPLWARPLVALDALAFYDYKLVAPVRLAMDYSRSPDWLVGTPFIWWTWAIPVAIAAAVLVLARRRAPWLPAAALFPVAALLPVLGLVRFDFQSHSTVADHYVYVALLGPALVLALALSRRTLIQTTVIGGLILLPLAFLSRLQVPVWHDSTALFTHTLDINPRSVAGHINLGHILFVQGRTEEALRHDEAALVTRPDEPEAHNNMGNALLRLKRPTEAAEHYRAALRSSPDSVTSHFNLGLALSQSGDPAGAAREYDEALRLQPRYAAALANRAELFLNAGEYDKAIDLYRRALEVDPGLAPARRGLSNTLRRRAGRGALSVDE